MPYLTPIALFTFKRPKHTLHTLESLAKNPEFLASPFFIYCDGARNNEEKSVVEETRQLIRDWQHPNKTIIERDHNWGLANSVITGVSDLCERFGSVIVVEDDLIVSPAFLNYLNTGLVRYADEPKVMQISAHMFPVEIQAQTDAIMLPFTTSWGWATWSRAWQSFDPDMQGYNTLDLSQALRQRFDLDSSYPYFKMLKQQKAGTVDSWAIRWYLSVFLQNGVVLFPKQTLVLNEGFDGSGSNCKTPQLRTEVLRHEAIVKFPPVTVDEQSFDKIKLFLRREQFIVRKLVKYVGAIWARYTT